MALTILLVWFVGWLFTTPFMARWYVSNKKHCHGVSRISYESICVSYHDGNCWRSDDDVTPSMSQVGGAATASLVWPLLLPLLLTYKMATKPKKAGKADSQFAPPSL